MDSEQIISEVDGFRFITNLQTTARQLIICSQIIKQLNNRQLPKRILEELLIHWSYEEEKINRSYGESKGKITKQGTPTAALRHYFSLAESLGLIKSLGNVFVDTNVSYTLMHFLESVTSVSGRFNLAEELFYLYQLLIVDADGVLFCLDQLNSPDYTVVKSQSLLQKQFKEAFNKRLVSKSDIAQISVKTEITEKFRTVNYVWRKSDVYAEHIIAPRYEWLSTLGLVTIDRRSGSTMYSMSKKGLDLYNLIPSISSDSQFKDITQNWIFNHFFSTVNQILPPNNRRLFISYSYKSQVAELGEALEKASKHVKSSITSRLPVDNTYLFICMYLFIEKGIVINFREINDLLSNSFTFNSRSYLARLAGRANESYISITLNR